MFLITPICARSGRLGQRGKDSRITKRLGRSGQNTAYSASALIGSSRKSHSVFASGTVSAIPSPQKRIQLSRSLTIRSVASRLRPCRLCSTSIRNFNTPSREGRPPFAPEGGQPQPPELTETVRNQLWHLTFPADHQWRKSPQADLR
mgnify:CR=1 FL=1